ncbi:rCG37541 [Rattus norvegicus]|uniref:RCG37541 n=1 Tax=Rattus norvegicus TaxID=10116 RepID=A6KI42_RAT|nr:rCG37541 [Rattus norvegicus]
MALWYNTCPACDRPLTIQGSENVGCGGSGEQRVTF